MKNAICLVCMLLIQLAAKAQMKIGDNPANINSASLLELESANKGLVFPNIALTDVSSPDPLPAGLLSGTTVYNTNGSILNGNGAGLYVWNGFVWMSVVTSGGSSSGWSLTGNLGIAPGPNFLGTLDAADLVVKTGDKERLRILGTSVEQGQPGYITIGGLTAPRSILDITASLPGTNIITIQNADASGYSTIDMRDNSGNITGTFGYANSSAGSLPGMDYFDVYNKDFVITAFGPNSSNFFLQGSSTGYIGIGTNVPQQRLHVHGKFHLDSAFMPLGNAGLPGQVLSSQGPNLPPTWSNPGNVGGSWLLNGNTGINSSTNFLGTKDSVDLVIKTDSSERLRILGVAAGQGKPGYVGIGGLFAPRSLLDVTANLPNIGIVTIQNSASSGYSSIDMLDSSGQLAGTFGYANTGAGFLGGLDYFNVYNRDFVITAFGSNNNNFFLQGSSTGYIGIGTNVPQQRLHVHGNLQLDSAFIVDGSAGLAGQVLYSSGPGLPPTWLAPVGSGGDWSLSGNTNTNSGINFLGTLDNISLRFRTNNVERMMIDSIGNVGISTTTPNAAARLDVNGAFKLGPVGTVIGNIVKTTATNPSDITINKHAAANLSLPATGIATGATVIVNPRVITPLPVNIAIAYAYVSAPNTVTIDFITNDNGSATIPANTTFDITVIQ